MIERLEQKPKPRDAVAMNWRFVNGRVTCDDLRSIQAFLQPLLPHQLAAITEEDGVFTVDYRWGPLGDLGGGGERIKLQREGQTWRILEKFGWVS